VSKKKPALCEGGLSLSYAYLH